MLVQGVTDYAIYMLDPEGRVTNWNAGAERIKGYAPDEIVGQHFCRFYTAGGPRRRRARTRARDRARDGPLRGAKAGGCARTAPASGRAS